MLLAVAVAVKLNVPDRADAHSVILFLAILPLANAFADFASTGLTRWRLRRGLAPGDKMWREAGLDTLGAVTAFLLLGAAMILAVDWIRWADGTALFDLPELFADLRANPGRYWWLHFTLFSTLIPTVLHLSVWLLGGVMHWPWLREYIVDGLDAGGRGDEVAGRWAARALCLAMTVSVVAPVIVLGHIVQYHGIIGYAVLDLFEAFARLVGAI